jgi:polysaccharide biosynthesis/export protein
MMTTRPLGKNLSRTATACLQAGLPLVLLFFLLLAAATSAQQTVQTPVSSGNLTMKGIQTGTPDLARRDGRYKLSATDSIALTFPLTPEFNQTVVIEPDGFASLAGAESVRLEGMTTDEAVAAIRQAYAKVLRDPVISVELKDFNKPYFIVNGQVNKPGKYDLRGYTSASEAVADAGGFSDTAKHSQVLLFRRVNDQWFEVKSLDLKRILSGRNLNEDAELQSGDMLYVPRNFISKVTRYIPSSGFGAYYQLHP